MLAQLHNTKGIELYRVPWNLLLGSNLDSYKQFDGDVSFPNLDCFDLWVINLTEITLTNFESVLSEHELGRIEKIRIPKQRIQRLKSRVLLRQILGEYLDENPSAITFDYNVNGKPNLAAHLASTLSFNVSHSGTSLVILVNNTHQVGVDIETLPDTILTMEQIGERFFSHKELIHVKALRKSLKKIALLRLWTIKEAILKAKGLGVFVIDQQECLSETQISGSKTVLPLVLDSTIGFSILLETHMLACIRYTPN